MVAHVDLNLGAEWVCVPTDWEEIKEIRIRIEENRIEALYVKPEAIEKEVYLINEAVQRSDGMLGLKGTPFSLLRFSSENRIIISRLPDGKERPYSYIFKAEKRSF